MATRRSDYKYTPAFGERICELIAEGCTLRQIAAQEGINRSTILRWLRNEPEFRGLYWQAHELWAEAMAHELIDIASDGSNDWIDRETASGRIERVIDHEHVQRSRLRIDAIKWVMAHRAPKRWGDPMRNPGPEGEDPVPGQELSQEERRRRACEEIDKAFAERPVPSEGDQRAVVPSSVPQVNESLAAAEGEALPKPGPREFAREGALATAVPEVARPPRRYRRPRLSTGGWSG